MHPVRSHNLSSYPPDLLQRFYATMRLIRRFEERANQLTLDGKVPGTIHVSIGQEACAAGACLALRPDDYVMSNHRGHGHCIAKGVDLPRMMAEILGKQTGTGGGCGGHMHILAPEAGLLGTNGIVGGGLPVATGAGYSIRVRGTDQVCLVFFGEGAANEGSFHESLNLATLWDLPVLFICENNQYAELTPQHVHMKGEDVASRGQAYGIPGVVVDGTDVLAVYDAVSAAVATARGGAGPALIECKTYRWHGHFAGDPQTYRSKDEVQEWMARDPIAALRDYLLETGAAAAGTLAGIDSEIEATLESAIRFGMESPAPQPQDVTRHVYAG